jgi:hypothetical protein
LLTQYLGDVSTDSTVDIDFAAIDSNSVLGAYPHARIGYTGAYNGGVNTSPEYEARGYFRIATRGEGTSGVLADRFLIDYFGNTMILTGNMLVGTTTDAGYKLDVNGTGRFSGNITGTADLTLTSTGGHTINMVATTAGSQTISMTALGGGSNTITGTGGDLNIQTTGAYPLVFKTNSTEDLRITSDGKVGIGTSSPAGGLDSNVTSSYFGVNGQDNYVYLRGYNSARVRFASNVGVSGNYNGLSIQTNETNANSLSNWRMDIGGFDGITYGTDNFWIGRTPSGGSLSRFILINSSGNVGIGTTSPGSLLHIAGTGSPRLTLQDTDSGSGNVGILFKENTTDQWALASVAGDIVFYNEVNAATRMIVKASGNVGIGTTSPISAAGYTGFTVYNATTGGIIQTTNGTVDTRMQISSSAGYLGTFSNHDIIFVSNATEGLRIKAGGNVLIGTTTDAGQKLQVAGAVRLTTNPSVTGDGSSAQFWNQAGVGPTIAGANFQVQTNGATSALYINSSQNVGIGTTSPSYKLHVVGDAYVSGSLYASIFESISLGTATAGSVGWFKIGSIVDRGGGIITLSVIGGSYTPVTYEIKYYKNWTSDGTLQLSQYAPSAYITDARIRQDAANSLYYIEIYVAAAVSFQVYHQKLLGYNATGTAFTGTLAAGSASGTTITQLPFRAYGLATQGITLTPFNGTSAVAFQRNVSGTIYNYGSVVNSGSDILYQGTGSVFINADSDSDSTSTDREVRLGNRGVAYATLNSIGNLGIGTGSPSYKLHVVSSNYQLQVEPTTAVSMALLKPSAAAGGVNALSVGVELSSLNTANFRYTYNSYGSSSNYVGIGFWANDDILNVVGTGRVGIGITTPTTKLHIKDTASAQIRIDADSDNVTETDVAELLMTQDGGVSTANFSLTPDSVNNLLIGVNSTTAPGIIFATRGDGTSFPTSTDAKMVILNGGNVGIGTTSPGVKLDVSSDIRTSTRYLIDTGTANQSMAIGFWDSANARIEGGSAYPLFITSYNGVIKFGPSGGETLRITAAGELLQSQTNGIITQQGGTGYALHRLYGNSNGVELQLDAHQNSGAGTIGTYSASALILKTSNTERMRITSGGVVLINQTSLSAASAGAKMQVATDMLTTGSLAGYFFENRSGGVTTSTNWAGWYYSGTTIRLYNGASDILSIVASTGNFLIGTTTDAGYKLDVSGTIRSTGINYASNFYAGGSSYDVPNALVVGADTNWTFGSYSASGIQYWMQVKYYGVGDDNRGFRVLNVNGNTIDFRVNGAGNGYFRAAVYATSFFESSDKNIKELIKNDYLVKDIDTVTAKLYIKDGKQEVGYFAQDVQELLPSAVTSDKDGLLSLSYREVLVAKVQLLEQKIKELEAKLS